MVWSVFPYSPPFNAPNQEILAIKVKEGKFRPIPSHYSAELQAVINKLLKVDVSCNVCATVRACVCVLHCVVRTNYRTNKVLYH